MSARRAIPLLTAVAALVAGLLTAVSFAAPAQAATTPSAVLRAPGTLGPGGQLQSSNGNFRLVMYPGGNLALYNRWHRAMWSTRTGGHRNARLQLLASGRLQVVSASGRQLWSTQRSGRRARLVLRNNGVLALTSGSRLLWHTRTAVRYGSHDNPTPASRLASGHTLASGHQLVSYNRRYRAVMGRSGGFAVVGPGSHVIWTTGTSGWIGARIGLTRGGDLVLRSASGSVLWSSGTSGGVLLVIGDGGNLVLYNSRGRVIWQSRGAAEPQLAPAVSTSHYIRSTADLTSAGCADAKANGTRRSAVVLDIGAQENDLPGGAWGVKLSATATKLPDTQLVSLLQSYIAGYGGCMAATGRLLLAVATNNDSRQYYTAGRCPLPPTGSADPLGAEGGAEWANVIGQLASAAAGYPGITVAGSNDIEPGFAGCEPQASAWISALLAKTSQPFVFIGSADDCPAALGDPGSCLAGWTQQQLHDLAYGLNPTRSIPLPQIYTPGMAVQWANISRNGGSAIRFGGVLTEQAACATAGGCTSLPGAAAWNELSNQLTTSTGRRTYAGGYVTDLRIN